MQKFKLMLVKRDDASKAVLHRHLQAINDHLSQRDTRFLTGDTMCCFDCELMPKLQHIRVAGELPVIYYHLFTIYLLSTIIYLLSTIIYLLSTIIYLLSTIIYLLSTIIYLLSTIIYLLSTVVLSTFASEFDTL